MIKLKLKIGNTEKVVSYPDNLLPTVFKCIDCGCTIKRLEDTDSYILMSTSVEVDRGTKKLCAYCFKLHSYRGME